MSGTHAIAAALFGVLRPGDELLAAAGAPYDTLEEVIGTRRRREAGGGDRGGHDDDQPSASVGSLADWGVSFRFVPLGGDGGIDYERLAAEIGPRECVGGGGGVAGVGG